jgi:predicted TIM-barrel fold metal-dependent hydrolase
MLGEIDRSVAELDRVLALGARVVALMAGPVAGRSPGDRYFDPFWARLQEADVPAAFHIGDSGYSERVSTLFGQKARPTFREMTALQFYLGFGSRPIADTLAALVLGDTFGRFPDLKVMSLENGSTWVRQLLHDLDHAAKFARRAETLSDLPSDMFRNNVYVSPFFEENGLELAELIGADHVLFGSDFPHPEGPAEPIEFVENLGGMSEGDIRLVMRENTARLLRIDLDNA